MLSYFVIVLFILVLITLVLVLIILVFELVLIVIEIAHVLESESLASKPVDCARDELLLDVLTELVVELKLLLDLLVNVLVLVRWWGRRVEEVEERRCGDGLLDNAGLLGV